jgi:hypothetical protein
VEELSLTCRKKLTKRALMLPMYTIMSTFTKSGDPHVGLHRRAADGRVEGGGWRVEGLARRSVRG